MQLQLKPGLRSDFLGQNINKSQQQTQGLLQKESISRWKCFSLQYIYRCLAVLLAFGPDFRERRLHHLQSLLVGQLQLLRLLVELKEHQRLQQAVDLLCRGARGNEPSVKLNV